MLKFEYEIRLNESGRPYVHIPETYMDKPEDKFMALELTRYIINNLVSLRESELSETELNSLKGTYSTIELLSDEIALLLKKQMENKGEASILVYNDYHVTVNNIEERNKLNYEGFIHKGKIFKRKIGLRVLVLNEMNIYELSDGIDNDNWKKL